jgi:cell shape-determining protein MreC
MACWTNAENQARWRKRRARELKQLRTENKRLRELLMEAVAIMKAASSAGRRSTDNYEQRRD